MAIDERSRLELAAAARRALGEDAGVTLMEMLPPVGWGDVATKRDLDHLHLQMTADIQAAINSLTWRMLSFMVAFFGAIVAVVKL